MIAMQPVNTFTVLIVGDEACLGKAIRAFLAASGFVVEEARTGADAIAAIKHHHFEIVLLDISMSGVEACRQIRALAPRAGIVVATIRDSEEDQVRALEAGADDYVSKPFRFRELVARLGAVLRRTSTMRNYEPTIQVGDLKLEFERHILWKRGEQIRLSPKEFELLAYLMKNHGAPITHTKLLRAVWGPHAGELEYLRSYVRMLRKKIEDNPAKPEYILTEAWVGYRFGNPEGPDQSGARDDP